MSCVFFISFFSPNHLLTLYTGLIRPCMKYASHVRGGSTHRVAKQSWVKAFCLINSPPPQPLILCRNFASLAIFLNSLTAWLLPYLGLDAQNLLPIRIPIPSTHLMQELTSIFILLPLQLTTGRGKMPSEAALTHQDTLGCVQRAAQGHTWK